MLVDLKFILWLERVESLGFVCYKRDMGGLKMEVKINDTEAWDSLNDEERQMLRCMVKAKTSYLPLSYDDLVIVDKIHKNEKGEISADMSVVLMEPLLEVKAKGKVI